MENQKTGTEEILEALGLFSNNVSARFQKIDQRFEAIDQRFEAIDQRFEKIDQRFEAIDQRFEAIDQRFDKLEGRVTKIEANMVTKDYLDQKLSDLKGDLVLLFRGKNDPKLEKLSPQS